MTLDDWLTGGARPIDVAGPYIIHGARALLEVAPNAGEYGYWPPGGPLWLVDVFDDLVAVTWSPTP